MVVVAGLGAFGALIGSFLNVVVYRVPRGMSVVAPPSACGSCGRAIRPYDNIPLVSWFVLRGRCRDCRAPISARYPLVELAGAVGFGIVGAAFLPRILTADGALPLVGGVVELVAYLYFAAISLALALIDLDTRRLPNVIVLPAYAVAATLFTATAGLTGSWDRLAAAGIGLGALGGLYLVLALARPGGMGMGDVKLAGVAGAFLGWLGMPELAVGGIAAFLLGGVVGVGMLLAGRGRRAAIAFGPWLLAGTWIGALAGRPIADAYLSLFGIT